jgi:putative nucleotidyltransferase with HDIG domain
MNQEEFKAGNIKSKVWGLEKLATFEPVTSRFTSYLENNETSLSDLSRWIALDPVLTCRILKIANSPSYGFTGQVTTVNLATVIIGLKALRELVWSISVMDQFTDQQKLIDQSEVVNLWYHGNYAGIAARYLAELAGYPVAGEAFVAGLLHDIGYQVMVQQFPEIYSQVMELSLMKNIPFQLAEKQLLGFGHSEVGAWLGEAWGFPRMIIEVIRYHHAPSDRDGDSLLVKIVYLADLLAHSLREKNNPVAEHWKEISETEIMSRMKKFIPCNGHDLDFYQDHILSEGEKLNEVLQDTTLMFINA